jgi:hypothetical protein
MKAIAPAFVKAKREFGPALKKSVNPHLKNKYADLGACLEAVEDALLNNGIALMQDTSEDATGVTVETVFLHESGEQIRCGRLHVPASKQDPQGYGSALTYARRYSLMTACGIAQEDDDGNAAARPVKKSPVDYFSAIGNSADLVQLKSHFSAAWKMADAADKDALKAAYDKRTEQLTQKATA